MQIEYVAVKEDCSVQMKHTRDANWPYKRSVEEQSRKLLERTGSDNCCGPQVDERYCRYQCSLGSSGKVLQWVI